MKKLRLIAIAVVGLAAGFGAVLLAERQGWIKAGAVACRHGLAAGRCPFCDRSLVERGGKCAEHGGPEALCWLCHPELVAGYEAEKDWCAAHALPESRCVT